MADRSRATGAHLSLDDFEQTWYPTTLQFDLRALRLDPLAIAPHVFRGRLEQKNIVCKIVPKSRASDMDHEREVYDRLISLWGNGVPQPYGLFDFHLGKMLILSDEREPLDEWQSERQKVYDLVQKVHDLNVVHNDLHLHNVLKDKDGKLTLVGFTDATGHLGGECYWTCPEPFRFRTWLYPTDRQDSQEHANMGASGTNGAREERERETEGGRMSISVDRDRPRESERAAGAAGIAGGGTWASVLFRPLKILPGQGEWGRLSRSLPLARRRRAPLRGSGAAPAPACSRPPNQGRASALTQTASSPPHQRQYSPAVLAWHGHTNDAHPYPYPGQLLRLDRGCRQRVTQSSPGEGGSALSMPGSPCTSPNDQGQGQGQRHANGKRWGQQHIYDYITFTRFIFHGQRQRRIDLAVVTFLTQFGRSTRGPLREINTEISANRPGIANLGPRMPPLAIVAKPGYAHIGSVIDSLSPLLCGKVNSSGTFSIHQG
ncbi:hypothetical protein DACRYDRAFT_104500 [Dacryopinax primogenitus]|uniref:Protein kinase domain-containing protein n=1 Tax=Dacryopinax primogenitus (strain DJM 731) TaxID=1858805 RepID=M5G312_DACPD|nr:uncharacterized protein DACRYDRAFT_104500 [Dacryopinax primogenitus]EJU04616.1 hypothetical protein DACRYDRAFT_104500 [Dacryopinax primogenitus]